jgi:hypothetical protein
MALITEKTDLDSLVNQIGEVQINPTQYTVLERLKQLEASNNIITNPFFEIKANIIRPSNVIAYAINQAVSISAIATNSLYFDFGVVNANKIIEINDIVFVSDNQNSPDISPQLYISEQLSDVAFQDGVVPVLTSVQNLVFIPNSGLTKLLGNSTNWNYLRIAVQFGEKMILDANGKLYYGIVSSTVVTPKSGGLYAISLKGRYL